MSRAVGCRGGLRSRATWRRVASVAVASALLGGATVVALPAVVQAAPAVAPVLSASERAAASGEPVEDVAQRTAYSTTLANPDGTFTLTQSTTPSV